MYDSIHFIPRHNCSIFSLIQTRNLVKLQALFLAFVKTFTTSIRPLILACSSAAESSLTSAPHFTNRFTNLTGCSPTATHRLEHPFKKTPRLGSAPRSSSHSAIFGSDPQQALVSGVFPVQNSWLRIDWSCPRRTSKQRMLRGSRHAKMKLAGRGTSSLEGRVERRSRRWGRLTVEMAWRIASSVDVCVFSWPDAIFKLCTHGRKRRKRKIADGTVGLTFLCNKGQQI